MGKKTRGKRRHNKRNQNHGAAQAGADNNNTTSNNNNNQQQQQRPLLQRLRHADRLTRHAALTALAEHPHLLPASRHNRKSDGVGSVLTAVSELVVREPDGCCATAAASCLGNYLELLVQEQEQSNGSNDNPDEQRTAGWLVIFLKRLQQSMEQMATTNNVPKDAAAILQQQQQQLIQECLRSTVLLLETNPLAVERLVRQHANELFSVFTHLLLTQNNNGNDNNSNIATTSSSITMWVCRGLHSTWDDNPALVSPFLANSDSAKATLQALHDTIVHQQQQQARNHGEAALTVVHGIGAWLSAWLIALQQQPHQSATNTTSSAHSSETFAIPTEIVAVLDSQAAAGVETLLHTLRSFDVTANSGTAQLRERLQTAFKAQQAQRADGSLEREVLQRQNQKKEPARLIARRLQQQKQARAQAAEAAAAMDVTGGDDGAVDRAEAASLPCSGKLPEDRQDCEELWDAAVTEWQAILQPVRIALEIVANLTAGSRYYMGGHDDDDGDDARMEDAQEPLLPEPLVAILVQARLPDRLLSFLDQLVDHIPKQDEDDEATAGLVHDSLVDLLSKTTAGLGHCLANLPTWKPAETTLWSVLQKAAPYDTSAMVVALQRRPELVRSHINYQFLIDLLARSTSQQQQPVSARDCICMLGIWCTAIEPWHSASVNEQVCRALLQASTAPSVATIVPDDMEESNKKQSSSQEQHLHQHPSAMVLAEALSVLMDIYGDDDRHPATFAQLGVLKHFQTSLPLLKQRIAVEELGVLKPFQTSLPQLEQWKETAMNAGRFIQYKKGHT